MAPPVENLTVSNREEDSMNNEPSQSGKPIVGIIYPPPEIRNIVDKTAGFVARNGLDFENRIKASEQNNPKFNFLGASDPYNAYYQNKVKEFREGTATVEPSIARPSVPVPKTQDAFKQPEVVPTIAPPDYEFMADAATINALDLDVIKLTALFCARNGRTFLTQIMNREARNPQFDFLKPQHSSFPYFTKLVEQYTKVLLPPKDQQRRFNIESTQPKKVLETIKYRVDWERQQRRLKEKEEAAIERERVAYASVDWHDFVVVQTVDYQSGESMNLPPPCTPKDVGARLLAQARAEAAKEAITQDVEMEVDSDEEEAPAPPPPPQEKPVEEAAPPKPETVQIRPYNPKNKPAEKVKVSEKWVISPLTGERIPADKLAEHMRYNTLDAQYYSQREKEMADKNEEPVYASGIDVSSNIRAFADRRTDIFGVGAEQTAIGLRLGEEEEAPRPDPRAIWDGQSSTAAQVQQQAQSKISIEQQLAEIEKHKALTKEALEKMGPQPGTGANTTPLPATAQTAAVPPPPPAMMTMQTPAPPPPAPAPVPYKATGANTMPLPPRMGVHVPPAPAMVLVPSMPAVPVVMMTRPPIVMPPQQQPPPPMPMAMPQPPAPRPPPVHHEEPPAKRDRPEPGKLPENVFSDQYPEPYTVRVQVPQDADKADWKLNGQTLNVQVTVTDTVAILKQYVQEEVGMPASKQKFMFEGTFMKDSSSFALYNIGPASVVQLQIKERGGRKK